MARQRILRSAAAWAAAWAAAMVLLASPGGAGAQAVRLSVAPADTDPRLPASDPPHEVRYERAVEGAADRPDARAPLLVWLPGTGGQPETGPQAFYATVQQQGWRLLALSTINTPAVAQMCTGALLRSQPRCASLVRQQRTWGQSQPALLPDRPEDAIVPRLVALLRHLVQIDPAGQWQHYLDGDEPRWAAITLAGQSQGGGMAATIAQARSVAGVLMFSGGWDRQPNGDLADWYRRPSQTPPERWHATYHVAEPQADALARSYQLLGVPAAQQHALDLPVQGPAAHGEGIRNPAYAPLWRQMLARPR